MLFFNEDWIHFLWTRYEYSMPVDEKALKDFIYQYKGTQITDFCLNVNGTVSSAKSNILETFHKRFQLKEENGTEVDYENSYARTAYQIIEEQGLDQYKIWVDTLREINIRPWISIRMNDCHGNLAAADLRKSSFVEQRKDLWRVRHREAREYFDKCFDYSLPEVRKGMLAYIEEMLDRYQPDGLELDFTREMSLVGIGHEYDSFEIIEGFIEDVHNLVSKEKVKAGHDIKLGVLVGANITATFQQGFDIKAWCDKGLIDFVTILPRWRTINTNMDIGLWKRLISKDVKLGTGLQLLVSTTAKESGKMALIDHDFGQAAANLSLGADFIYLYNHFDVIESGLKDVVVEDSIREPENLRTILCNIATLETAMNFKRRHILTYDDYHGPWEEANPRLPLGLNRRIKQLRIAVGKIKKGSEVELVLGFEEEFDPAELKVYINSTKLSFKRMDSRKDRKGVFYHYEVPDDIIKTYAVIEVSHGVGGILNFAEIVVECV